MATRTSASIEAFESLLGAVLSEEEMQTVSDLLGRLSDRHEDCSPGV